jgi:hypothetical protein
MIMADTINQEVISIVSEVTKMAANIMLKKVAGDYKLDANDLELDFEAGNYCWKVSRGDKVRIICGNDMRPTNPKEFGMQLRQVLQFISDNKLRNCVSIESVNTIKARNDKYAEIFKNMRKKKLIPVTQLTYRKFTSVLVYDEVSKESVMVSGEEISIWDLQNEAHILLSKKVLGE